MSLLSLRPLVWGIPAKNFYVNSKPRDVREQKINRLMANFNTSKLDDSISYFATDVALDGTICRERDLLDPRFVLPVLVHATDVQGKINCEMFVKCKCLSYAISSLTSGSDEIRKLGYMILNRFHEQVEMSDQKFYKERDLWLTFLYLIRSSSSSFNQLNTVVGLVLIDFIEITLSPDDFMYDAVKAFISSEESESTTKGIVRFLFSLLNYSDKSKFKFFEGWCLAEIYNGLKSEADFDAYIDCHVFRDLMSYNMRPYLDRVERVYILNIFSSVVKHPSSLDKLNASCAFLPWMMQQACVKDHDPIVKKACQNMISKFASKYMSETKIKEHKPRTEPVYFDDLSCILCLAAM